jgi:hypothetical protein
MLVLPTDTSYLAPVTRQYELFGRPLGPGVPRRTLAVAVVACAVWWTLLVLFGVSLVTRVGPAVFLVPPVVVVHTATRVADDGRITLLRWYDAALAALPARRRPVGNPLLELHGYRPVPLTLEVTTEVHDLPHGDAVVLRGPGPQGRARTHHAGPWHLYRTGEWR